MHKLVIQNDGANDFVCELKPGKNIFGRGEGNSFSLEDNLVSEHHCEVNQSGREVYVRDLNSSNGTFIGDRRITESILLPGQQLRIGSFRFVLEVDQPQAELTELAAPDIAEPSTGNSYFTSTIEITGTLEWLVRCLFAIAAGSLVIFVDTLFPYYPSGWPVLIAVLVAVIWMTSPTRGMYFALLVLVLPIARNVSYGLGGAIIFLPVVLEPFGFLLASVAAVLICSPALSWLLPLIPLTAGLRSITRGVVVGLLICFLAETAMLLGGHPAIGMLAATLPDKPPPHLQTESLKSLGDFTWVTTNRPGGSRLLLIGKSMAEQPILFGQLLLWGMTGAMVGRFRKQKLLKSIPRPIFAVSVGGLFLLVGQLGLWAALGKGAAEAGAAIFGIPVCTALVAVSTPYLEAVIRLLARKVDIFEGEDPADRKTVIIPKSESVMPPGAIFISYARTNKNGEVSDDARIAQRIRDTLQFIEVDVWLDEAGLGEGDEYEKKIQRYIRNCSIFMPVISQTTEQRTEGFFRKEWYWAVQRLFEFTGTNRKFIMPIVIDETPLETAKVPDEFRKFQWTVAPQGIMDPTSIEFIRATVRDIRQREKGQES